MAHQSLKGKTVLVTGARGFVGAHLVDKLTSLGAVVIGVSRNSMQRIDVTDRRSLSPLIEKKPNVIFHLAGEALVERGREAPYDTFRTNVMGTLTVLELSRLVGIQRIIVASTAHVYGAGESPFHEDSPPRPSRPYETSKAATDIIAQSYADSFNLPVVIPRFVNIYGPGDTNVSRLIPKTIKHLVMGEPVPLWGGSAKREYLYIDDAVEAYCLLAAIPADKLEKNRIFNFGAGEPISAHDLVTRIADLAGQTLRIVRVKEGRGDEIPRQYVSWDKARRMLGWRPRVSLDEGLMQTIAWYRRMVPPKPA